MSPGPQEELQPRRGASPLLPQVWYGHSEKAGRPHCPFLPTFSPPAISQPAATWPGSPSKTAGGGSRSWGTEKSGEGASGSGEDPENNQPHTVTQNRTGSERLRPDYIRTAQNPRLEIHTQISSPSKPVLPSVCFS